MRSLNLPNDASYRGSVYVCMCVVCRYYETTHTHTPINQCCRCKQYFDVSNRPPPHILKQLHRHMCYLFIYIYLWVNTLNLGHVEVSF